MKAEPSKLVKFLDRQRQQLIIPIYQRPYSWEEKHCRKLWDDIEAAARNEDVEAHFMGSVVYIEKGVYQASNVSKLVVIDGQQRLTSITLLLRALIDRITEIDPNQNVEAEKNYYLFNQYEAGENRYKLILSNKDKTDLFKIVDGASDSITEYSLLKNNYRLFREILRNSKLTIDEIKDGISKLMVVEVGLDSTRDNPQLIFESMNATGKSLTQSDLVRNYILMGLDPADQEHLFNTYWYEMESFFGKDDFSESFDQFMRDYLTMKDDSGEVPNLDEIYEGFKQAFFPLTEPEAVVKDIHKYAKLYSKIMLSKPLDEVKKQNEEDERRRLDDKEIRPYLEEIKQLKATVTYPFILEVYADFEDKKLALNDFKTILRNIISYVFRRSVLGVPSNSLNKTFATYKRRIDKSKYLESFLAELQLFDSYRRFPNDKEFAEALATKDLYNFRNHKHLFDKFENYERKERVNVSEYSVEHIMPQNAPNVPEWVNEIGKEKFNTIYERYLNSLGNLTLTHYNTEYSDRPFSEKKTRKDGYDDSPLRLDEFLKRVDKWNEENIIERSNQLVKRALEIWKTEPIDEAILAKYKEKREERNNIYTIEDFEYLDGSNLELFNKLSNSIKNLSFEVKEEIKKLYIAYKIKTNFVDIIPSLKGLTLAINLKFSEINDPKNLCKDVTGMGRWGNGDVEYYIDSEAGLEYAMFLIRQSFTHHEKDYEQWKAKHYHLDKFKRELKANVGEENMMKVLELYNFGINVENSWWNWHRSKKWGYFKVGTSFNGVIYPLFRMDSEGFIDPIYLFPDDPKKEKYNNAVVPVVKKILERFPGSLKGLYPEYKYDMLEIDSVSREDVAYLINCYKELVEILKQL